MVVEEMQSVIKAQILLRARPPSKETRALENQGLAAMLKQIVRSLDLQFLGMRGADFAPEIEDLAFCIDLEFYAHIPKF
jgi:hypothetical protein